MAKPVDFPEQNSVLRGGSPNVLDLHCFKDGGQIISKWELTPEEIQEIVMTGAIWCHVSSPDTHPPIYLTGTYPFVVQKN